MAGTTTSGRREQRRLQHQDLSRGQLLDAAKDDLFRQIFVRRGDEFMPGLREALRDEGTPVTQLHRLVDFEVGFFRRHPRFGRLYLRYSSATSLSADREIDAAMATNYAESMRLQADLFTRGQAAGAFRPGDPEVLARLFSGIISAYQALDASRSESATRNRAVPSTTR